MVLKDRKFELFMAPPRKVFEGPLLSKTMKEAGLVPSGQVFFAWCDLPETKAENGPFLDMMALKGYIKEL